MPVPQYVQCLEQHKILVQWYSAVTRWYGDRQGVTFLEHRETSLGRTQDVKIVDVAGTAHYLRYFVTQTPSGWKISGVQFLNITDISV